MDNKYNQYTIGEIAYRLGISVNTVRMYESAGLIIPSRTPTRRRIYSDSDLEWLKLIRKLITESGMSLEGIRRLVALIPCWEVTKCERRDECPAYYENSKPCWMIRHETLCNGRDCRDCEVYQKALFCNNMKNFLKVVKY
jgi:MerR family transcriptional regulator/heat shock protein HspR